MSQQSTFTLTISKVNELLFQGDAHSVTLPGTDGILTILAHHEPLITLLEKGIITVRENGSEKKFDVLQGLCETSHGQVTILV